VRNFDLGGAPDSKPVSIAAGDLNGDHKLDLIIYNAPSLGLYPGNGDGTFRPPILVSDSGVGSTSLLLADMNRDGKLDLIAYDKLWLGNGDGTFQTARDLGSSAVLVGDFNNDGEPDLLTSGIMLGNGDGTFQQPIPLPLQNGCGLLCQGSGSNFVEADFNGDGKLDLAFISATRRCDIGCSPYFFSTIILLGNGDGTFRRASGPPLQGFALVTDDFNGDGKPDLLAAPTVFHGSSLFYVALGKGDGTFPSESTFDVGSGPGYLLAADLNGDSLPDIVTTDLTEATASVVVNTSAASGADLSIRIAANPEPVSVTQPLTYQLQMTNSGPENASNVAMKNTLASGMTLKSVQFDHGTCTQDHLVVTCSIKDWVSGDGATATIVAVATITGSAIDNVTVTALEADL